MWEQNGITFTNDKASYNNNLGDYAGPVRIYAGTSVNIAFPGMTKIEINCNSGKPVAGLTDSLTNIPGITVTTNNRLVTIEFAEATDSFTIPAIAAQVRFDNLTVYAAAGSSEPEQPVETTATLSFADTSTRTSFSNTQQVWEQNGITFTNDKASYNNNLGDYAGPVRIYAGTSVNIAFPGMTKIEINCNSGKPVAGLTDSLTNIPGITVTTEGSVVTIEFAEATNAFTIPSIAAQVRFDELTVYATQASSGSQGGNNGGQGGNPAPENPAPAPSDPITNVEYVYGSSSAYANVIKNWGRRGFNATFLSPNAELFYVTNDVTYEDLAALDGSANLSQVPTSELYVELQELMVGAHTNQTTYGDTRYLYCFTDCQDQDNEAGISCFYSGNKIGPSWDSGSTWNREHCWPKSKTSTTSVNNSTSGECGDLMTLRPVTSNINSSRGNKAYGTGADFYNPNSAANGAYDLRGDVARLVLYTYVRWGNTSNMWGSDGVIESVEILLTWIEEDPVDTWELGRNDSVESVTGTRNVFVDYPELAFILFGEEIPTMVTPSGKAA